MKELWPSQESRDNFIRFLEFELKVGKCVVDETADAGLLKEFSGFLESRFPLTNAYILDKRKTGKLDASVEDIRAFAWAEARSSRDADGKAKVEGNWTRGEILEDIEECLRAARKNTGCS
ncbi:MAG: hypothetical protein JXA49_04190 [Actinobacteria bacterium]|nr:hypothetical protein [Actinomycetota bacterium]